MAARSRKSRGAAEAPAPISFEEALEQLESIVDQLEQGDLELEAAMTAFERGVALSKQCAARLDAAEHRIEVLTQQGGEWMTRPLDASTELSESDEVEDAGAPD